MDEYQVDRIITVLENILSKLDDIDTKISTIERRVTSIERSMPNDAYDNGDICNKLDDVIVALDNLNN